MCTLIHTRRVTKCFPFAVDWGSPLIREERNKVILRTPFRVHLQRSYLLLLRYSLDPARGHLRPFLACVGYAKHFVVVWWAIGEACLHFLMRDSVTPSQRRCTGSLTFPSNDESSTECAHCIDKLSGLLESKHFALDAPARLHSKLAELASEMRQHSGTSVSELKRKYSHLVPSNERVFSLAKSEKVMSLSEVSVCLKLSRRIVPPKDFLEAPTMPSAKCLTKNIE